MKLQFKHQQFQADAAKAVVDVFAGQPRLTPSYRLDKGPEAYQLTLAGEEDFTGWANADIVPELTDEIVLEHINRIQRENQIVPSRKLEGKYNLTIEMETGVGKTYTYIKTMYELNRHYGWSKFIVVVPSIAIREGVYKSFQMTREHFAEEYGRKIRFFIYQSSNLTQIDDFASDSSVNVMIINSQAFNAKGKDARRIYMKLDAFRGRRPIDIIAGTRPILIIDEPQSVEGKQTKENLKAFRPLMTLRYSATHRSDSVYNMIYRLDAVEAYNKRLVKKIAVKGITETGTTATDSYIYLESLNLSGEAPAAILQFEVKGVGGIKRKSRKAGIGFNLYTHSGELSEYEKGFIIKSIDGRDNSVEFINGIRIYAGDVMGRVSEEQLRRIQIRETILSHLERERQLFPKGIKVLSLFFVDEVAHYREYDEAGHSRSGIYARMFEEEYRDILENMQTETGDEAYRNYLEQIAPSDTHAGYFSIDKKGHMVDRIAGDDKKNGLSNDMDAYDLIMKNKELLLDCDPGKSPVRFIFSHSALREGWDNPNVFQICTLKQSGSEVRKRQEVGRGLRLCVNQEGRRMDANALGRDVHNVNVLTVIASESYDSFARGLQTEMAEASACRPKKVTPELFADYMVRDGKGNEFLITAEKASLIHYDLILKGYVNQYGELTEKYYKDKSSGGLMLAEEVREYGADVAGILDSIYDENAGKPENARSNNVELQADPEKLSSREFRELWSRINGKSVYGVNFDTEELVRKAIGVLNSKLRVPKIYFRVESGRMKEIRSREELLEGASMTRDTSSEYRPETKISVNQGVKYDLVGKLVEETLLTRKTVIQILTGIEKAVFNQFRDNPEEFILRAAGLINEEKAAVIIEHITYHALEERFDTDIFTEVSLRGKLGVNAMKAKKHLFDHVVYDSANEKAFAERLEEAKEVAVYIKLPDRFYIPTPVGRYTPDWAIGFYEGTVKHIYFVAETKGSADSMQLRRIEESKLHCAREHFKAISKENVVYDVADSYETLMEKAMG